MVERPRRFAIQRSIMPKKKTKKKATDQRSKKTPKKRPRRRAKGKKLLTQLGELEVLPPVIVATSRLPLQDHQIGWRKFEEFCCAFVTRLPNVVDCDHYGKQGDAQRGIDLVATMADTKLTTFQCRQTARFTGPNVRATVEKTKFKDATRHVILTAAEADVGARDEIRLRRNKWALWDVDDISQRVRDMSTEKAMSLVTSTFGDAWARAFLGVSGLAAFRSSDTSLAPLLDSGRLFNHAHPLVARADALTHLVDFARQKSKRVMLVSGAGGAGKTRLLLELAHVPSNDHPRILRVEENVPITDAALAQLPAGACLLIVDDAHRRADLGQLLALANQRTNVQLIVVTRPHAVERLENEIRYAKLEFAPTVALGRLSNKRRGGDHSCGARYTHTRVPD